MTTGVVCTPPILQFFDNNGNVLAGGSVLTQVGGVNTATYSDSGLTTALPNPIPLNARGEVSTAAGASSQLFLTPNTVYTFTVSDSGGNQIYVASYVNGVQLSGTTAAAALNPITSVAILNSLLITAAEVAAGVTPVNYAYPANDVRRMGVVGDGVTDDTAALQRCYTVGGEWYVAPGLRLNITATIIGVRATRLYSNSSVTPIPAAGGPQASVLHNFSGTFFDLQGSGTSQITGSGFEFWRLSFVQVNGNGTGSSGRCINNVQLSGTQECPWLRVRDCHFEVGNGANDWDYCIVLDGTNQVNPFNLRDHFISGCRFVSGTHATASVLLNGVSNIWISACEGNLAQSNLVITGSDASHLSFAVVVSDCAWQGILLDFVDGVYGAGNQIGTFTSTTNTIDVFLGTTVNVAQTIAGTRVAIFGKAPSGKGQIATNNNFRFETGTNPVEIAQVLSIGATPAASGPLRMENAAPITARNATNNADIQILELDSNNRVRIAPSGSDDIVWGRAAVALGGGAAPTLGTIGGSGPVTAAQFAWLKVYDTAGNACFLPIWK